MTKYLIKNSNHSTVATRYSAVEARRYLISKGTKFGAGVKRGWYIKVEHDAERIVGHLIVDRDTGEVVSQWPWSVGHRSNEALGYISDVVRPSLDYATQEVDYLNTLVGRGRYQLIDVVAVVH